MRTELLIKIVEKSDKDFALALVHADTLEKFAELIVQECVESIGEVEEQFFNGRIATDDFSEKNRFAEAEIACQMAKQKIKRQFGVE